MLHTLGVHLYAKQITLVNDSGNELPPRIGGIHGAQIDLNENIRQEIDDDDNLLRLKVEMDQKLLLIKMFGMILMMICCQILIRNLLLMVVI